MSETQRALINIEYKVYEPLVYAGALGLSLSGVAFLSQGPVIEMGIFGCSLSLGLYWVRGNLAKPTKIKRSGPRRNVIVNSAKGSRKVNVASQSFEYALQPGYISRETWGETLSRLVGRKPPQPATAPEKVDKPQWLVEPFFTSHYQGVEVQLLESDVTRFLNSAWKYRRRGIGLSQRRWVRSIKDRPQWYRNLGASWYFALIELLWMVEEMSARQMIMIVGHQQYALARDPHQTLAALRWATSIKNS